MTQIVAIALCVIGVLSSISAAVGLIRLPDLYHRLQCSTMLVTFGAVPILIAVVVLEGPISEYGGRALLAAVLLVVLAPATSHALGRSAYLTSVPLWRGARRDEPRQR